jgi:phage terminase large subunit
MLGAIKWLKEQPYTFERHYAPHDADAGEISSGRSRKDFARTHNVDLSVVQKHTIEDGIDAVRRQFSNMVFDERNCDALINALRSYRYEWDEKKQSFSKKPFHDWASHAADCTRYAVCGYTPPLARNAPIVASGMDFNPLNYEKDLRGLPTEAIWDFDPFTGLPRR